MWLQKEEEKSGYPENEQTASPFTTCNISPLLDLFLQLEHLGDILFIGSISISTLYPDGMGRAEKGTR